MIDLGMPAVRFMDSHRDLDTVLTAVEARTGESYISCHEASARNAADGVSVYNALKAASVDDLVSFSEDLWGT